MTLHETVLDLIPLHALGALESEEAAFVEAHLEWCDSCRSDMDVHFHVAASLVPDSEPPAGVWRRITDELEAVRVPPVRAARRLRLGWALAGALVVALLVGFAIGQSALFDEVLGAGGIVSAADTAAAQPGSFSGEFEVDGEAVARVVLTSDGEGFIVPSRDLDGLPADRTYQLWVVTPTEEVISAGVLGSDPEASTFTWRGEVSAFALTRETAGGVAVSEGDVVATIAAESDGS